MVKNKDDGKQEDLYTRVWKESRCENCVGLL